MKIAGTKRWNRCALPLVVLSWSLMAAGLGQADPPGGYLGLPSRPNIVLLTVDTLRADHTSAHGYDRKTTPVMGALSK